MTVPEPPATDGDAPIEDGLQLRRNAVRGFGVGAVVAAAVFTFFVLLPGTYRPAALYLGLAFVLGVSVGLLATIALVGWRVRGLTGDL